MKKKISITLDENILEDIDSVIDKLYIRNRSQAIEHLVQKSLKESKIAVILAGGPEEKLKVGGQFMLAAKLKGEPLVIHTINSLREAGFTKIFIIGRSTILTKAFEILKDGSAYGVKLNYLEEKESNGTASTLKLIKGKVTTRFLVVYGDIFLKSIPLPKIWEEHLRQNSLVTIMLTTSAKPSQKGTVVMEGNKILKFIQKPVSSEIYLVFSPIFVAEPELLEYPGNSLENEVFPILAEKSLLNGFVSPEKEVHIHCMEDIKKVKI
ncbi:MAG: sugar phosphate nucleotidyltransferase [Candidatus Woesearchaeota archaeon]